MGTRGTLALLLFLTYAYFRPPVSWNGVSRFALTRSIVERGRIDIDPYHGETGDQAFRDGHFYSDKAPGLSFAACVPYALYLGWLRVMGQPGPTAVVVGRDGVRDARLARGDGDDDVLVSPRYRHALHVVNATTNGAAGAWLGVTVLDVAALLGATPAGALIAAAGVGVGSLVLPYSTMFYGHVLAAALAFAGFAAALRTRVRGPSASRWTTVWAGFAAAAAVVVEYPCAIAAAVIAGYVVLTARRRGEAALAFAAGAVLPMAALLAYHTAAFGGPLRTGYAFVTRPEFAAGMSRGLLGVGVPRPSVIAASLLSRSRGLLYVTPVWAFAFVGLVALMRSKRVPGAAEGRAFAALVAAFLTWTGGYYLWWGGAALGPRHLIPALPFLGVGLAFVPRSRAWRAVFGVAMVVSAVHALVGTAVDAEAPFVRDVLVEHVWGRALRGDFRTANLATGFGLRGWVSLVPLVAFWAVGAALLRARIEPRAEHGA